MHSGPGLLHSVFPWIPFRIQATSMMALACCMLFRHVSPWILHENLEQHDALWPWSSACCLCLAFLSDSIKNRCILALVSCTLFLLGCLIKFNVKSMRSGAGLLHAVFSLDFYWNDRKSIHSGPGLVHCFSLVFCYKQLENQCILALASCTLFVLRFP